jgi:ubiquinone/menaquinone biosynthesis C-methylase UbiE
MPEHEHDKELAYLHDLYIAPDWSERFAELIDEHVKLPKEGRALYVAAGTGSHALALKERAGADVTLIGVDESEARLQLARAKAAAVQLGAETEFRLTQLEALDFEDDQFDLVVGDASLVTPERLPEMLAEMVRVAAPGGTVALNLPTASSFGEFFSIYWEALANAGLLDEAGLVEHLITELPTITDLEQAATREGLEDVQSWMNIEEFDYPSGADFLNAPLVKNFLLRNWLEPLTDEDERARVLAAITEIIDEERHEGEFSLSVKATLMTGQKVR